MTIGILAFGSLLSEPGVELQACVVRRIEGIETPFAVEFARSSRTRGGGPTLVPVTAGGAAVGASVLVLKDTVDEELARDLLYRRETRQVGDPVARLADLAVTSASGAAGADKRDGICYLEEQKRRGVVTPLMPGYEREVLARTGGRDLTDAWARARGGRCR